MFEYWPFSLRTMLILALAIAAWFAIAAPARAGADVSHAVHLLGVAASRLSTFVKSI